MIKRLLGSLREYKAPAVITLLLILGEAVIETFIPFITADLVNKIQQQTEIAQVMKTGLLLIIMAVLSLLCGGAAAFTCSYASAGFVKNLRSDMFRKIQTFSFENIDRFSSSSLVTRMTTDANNVQMSFMMLIRIALRSPLMLIFSITMAYIMGGALASAFVVAVPVLGIGLYQIAKRAMPAFRRVFKKYDRMNESIEENIRAMRIVKGFSREEYEKEKFKAAAEDICIDFTRAEKLVALNMPLMQLCMNFNSVFILYVGSKMVINRIGNVGIGQISAMLSYGVQVLMSLMMLSMIYVMLTMSAESAKRIAEVLDETPTLKMAENPKKTVDNGSVEFNNVNFKYSEKAKKYVLSDINIKIPQGTTVGIIGGTGSGKSSLVQLIPRLYDVPEGSVTVGGTDVRKYDIETLRNAVAMVLQKNLLFSGTIKENLMWGNENATDEEIKEACAIACADEFIETFPDKYETKIEQGGTNVSGGQRQRLCIARALLKKPKILILDDSTSAVDTKTDASIRKALSLYMPETTKIIIAQRISSVQDADMIIVMDNGRISATGTHGELLKSSGIYREIFEQQTNGGEDDE